MWCARRPPWRARWAPSGSWRWPRRPSARPPTATSCAMPCPRPAAWSSTCSRARRRRGSPSWAPRARSSSRAEGTIAVVDVGGGSSEIAVGEPDGKMAWSASFRIGSGFLADSYLRSDPPSVEELENVRSHVAGAIEGLEPPPADSRRGRGRHRHVAAQAGRRRACARDARARDPRALEHADPGGGRSASSSIPSGCACCRPASSCSRRSPTCSSCRCASRAAACARACCSSWWRGGGLPRHDRQPRRRSRASSDGRRSTLSSPRSTPASPPFFSRTCAPVSVCTAAEKSGSWPTSITSSPSPAASSSASNGPAARASARAAARRRPAPRRRAARCRRPAPSGW